MEEGWVEGQIIVNEGTGEGPPPTCYWIQKLVKHVVMHAGSYENTVHTVFSIGVYVLMPRWGLIAPTEGEFI